MTTLHIPTESNDHSSPSVESLQKRIIELQDAELVRLRLENSQLKFELSKLQTAVSGPVQPVSVPFNPYDGTWPKVTWEVKTTPPPFTTVYMKADGSISAETEDKK